MLVVFSVDISYFFVLLRQLHEVVVEFIVVDDFINLFYPFVVHEHLIVPVRDGFFAVHKL